MHYKSCLAIINPKGSQADTAKPHLDELRELFGNKFNSYELHKADYDAPKKLRARVAALTKESLLVIVGGDGTVNMVVNLLIETPAAELTTVLPLWAGNANDIATMLNGRRPESITSLIKDAQRKPSHPIQIDITHLKKTSKRYALAYFSIGATGSVMRAIESQTAKTNVFHEIVLSVRTMFKASTFASTQNTKRFTTYELAFLNGSRIAKFYRTPTSLIRREAIVLHLRRKHPVLIGHLGVLLRNFIRPHKLNDVRAIELHDATVAQMDGEVVKLDASTHLEVQIAAKRYFIATTNN